MIGDRYITHNINDLSAFLVRRYCHEPGEPAFGNHASIEGDYKRLYSMRCRGLTVEPLAPLRNNPFILYRVWRPTSTTIAEQARVVAALRSLKGSPYSFLGPAAHFADYALSASLGRRSRFFATHLNPAILKYCSSAIAHADFIVSGIIYVDDRTGKEIPWRAVSPDDMEDFYRSRPQMFRLIEVKTFER